MSKKLTQTQKEWMVRLACWANSCEEVNMESWRDLRDLIDQRINSYTNDNAKTINEIRKVYLKFVDNPEMFELTDGDLWLNEVARELVYYDEWIIN